MPRGLIFNLLFAASRIAPAALAGSSRAANQHLRTLHESVLRSRTAREAAESLCRGKPRLFALLRARYSGQEAQALAVKILNLLMAQYHFRARDTALVSRPIGITADPVNSCRLACPGCVHSEGSMRLHLFDWPNAALSIPLFFSLLRQYGPYAIGVYFCNYGEPLLNRRTPDLIRAAKRYLLSTALSSSLSVERFDAEAYVASGLDLMNLSIDGASQPVYARFRRGGRLDLVLENISALVQARKRAGKRTPALSWNFLAFEHNAHEIPQAERMARRLGLDFFRVVAPFDVSWDDPSIRPALVRPRVRRLNWTGISCAPENWNPFPSELDEEPIRAAFHHLFDPPSESGGATAPPGRSCRWLYTNIVLDAAGRILPCCGAPKADGALVFGSLKDPDSGFFNTGKFRQARAYFRECSRPPVADLPCSTCVWNQDQTTVGAREIRSYFRSAGPWFFPSRTVNLLADW